LQKEAGGVPGRVARNGSNTKTFWETIPTVLGDEIPNPHASVREASEPDLENRGSDGQKHRHSSAHAHAVVAAGTSSAASAGPQNHGAREGIEGEESAELETMIISSSAAERDVERRVGSGEREGRTPR
jgi:hypothetical protein